MNGIVILPFGLGLIIIGLYLYIITEGMWFYRPSGWGIIFAYAGTIVTTYARINILAFRKDNQPDDRATG